MTLYAQLATENALGLHISGSSHMVLEFNVLEIQKIGIFGSVLAPRVLSFAFCLSVESLGYGGIEHGSDDA